MTKRILTFSILFLLAFSLSSCLKPGTIDNAEIDYGDSVMFTDAEIKSAADAVLIKFEDFSGADLIRIWYDEEELTKETEGYISRGRGILKEAAEKGDIIILLSDFYVGSCGVEPGFNKDFTYTDWMWILIKDSETDEWAVYDWGY